MSNSKSEWCPNRDSFKDRDISEKLRKHCAEGFATCNSCCRFIALQTCKRRRNYDWGYFDQYFVKLYRHKLPEFLKAPKRTRKREKQKYYGADGRLLPDFEEEAKKNSSSSTD